jgi:CheY-like chemotaxis protein
MPDDAPEILLIVEDSMLAEVARFRLELLGNTVTTVPSAEVALQRLQENLPNLIVLDRDLPGMDGTEFVRRLKADERTAGIPALMLSKRAHLGDVQEAFDAGADDYLVTPFDPLVLERKVEALAAATTSL